jgi:putative hydrolase of the HAD superfamily
MKDSTYISRLLTDIDSIIFDLGGVVVNIDYMKTQQAFEALGLTSFGEVYSQAAQSGLFDLYEKGLIDTVTFRDRLHQLAPDFKVCNEDLDSAWNAMILDTPLHRLAILEKLKSDFRTFLLSNTNDLHIQYFHARLKAAFGKENLSDYFEQVYYSYLIHLRKPDKEIFEYVLRQNNLDAKKTLFVDDTIRHIEAAKSVGLHTLQIDSKLTLDELYSALSEY